jgi:hypothetical protein
MANATPQTQALARELARGNFDADDLPNLARNIYVRCLLKVQSVGGRSGHAKAVSLTVTGEVMRELVGMHFSDKDVQDLLDEGQKPDEAAAKAEPSATPAANLDPYDLGA